MRTWLWIVKVDDVLAVRSPLHTCTCREHPHGLCAPVATVCTLDIAAVLRCLPHNWQPCSLSHGWYLPAAQHVHLEFRHSGTSAQWLGPVECGCWDPMHWQLDALLHMRRQGDHRSGACCWHKNGNCPCTPAPGTPVAHSLCPRQRHDTCHSCTMKAGC
jgi:hypothetical protein